MLPESNTNFVYIADSLKVFFPGTYTRLTRLFAEMEIEWGEIPGTKDIWARDFMPIQTERNEFVMYRYWPDYCDNDKDRKFITDSHDCCRKLGLKCTEVSTLADGGNIMPCGDYYVMTTKVERTNTHKEMEELQKALHHPILLIPWHKISEDEPYGHSDGLIHWCGEKRVLMSNHRDTDPQEADEIRLTMEKMGFTVTEMTFESVSSQRHDLNWAYINYLQVGRKIIIPSFGIEEDRIALRYVQEANPDCEIRNFRMRDIARNGGALHCLTWNIRR